MPMVSGFSELNEHYGFCEPCIECHEELFWMLYFDAAFPYPGWSIISYLQVYHMRIDTSADTIATMCSHIQGEKLKQGLQKAIGKTFYKLGSLVAFLQRQGITPSKLDMATLYDTTRIVDNFKDMKFLFASSYGLPMNAYYSIDFALFERGGKLFVTTAECVDGCDMYVSNNWNEQEISWKDLYSWLKMHFTHWCTDRDSKTRRTIFDRNGRNEMLNRATRDLAPLVRRYLHGKDWKTHWQCAYELSQQEENPWDGLPMGYERQN